MNSSPPELEELWTLLASRTPDEACRILQEVLRFEPTSSAELAGVVGRVRAAWAGLWEQTFGEPVPLMLLRTIMTDTEACTTCERLWDVAASRTRSAFFAAMLDWLDELHRGTAHLQQVQAFNEFTKAALNAPIRNLQSRPELTPTNLTVGAVSSATFLKQR